MAVKNHHHGCLNPIAQYQMEITHEKVMKSPMVADPLHVFDCSPLTDGAAAVILAPTEMAKKYCDTPVKILGSCQASDTLALHDRRDMTTLDATVRRPKRLRPGQGRARAVDVAEVHDCFTIAEILAIEDLGFVEKGQGGKVIQEGMTALNGKLPVNTSGGLKACGHPVGATGIKQAYEIILQLSGQSRQAPGGRCGDGPGPQRGRIGGTALVHIFYQVKL